MRKVEVKRLFQQAADRFGDRPRLAFMLQSLEDPLNVGSLFRIADGCGAAELVMCGPTPVPPHPEVDRTSRGHERRIPWRHFGDIAAAARTLKDEGYHLVALETATGAQCHLDYPYPDKVCLVLGNESKGVYPATLKACDGAVYIPMFGKGPSLNVHVAAALVAYQVLLGRG